MIISEIFSQVKDKRHAQGKRYSLSSLLCLLLLSFLIGNTGAKSAFRLGRMLNKKQLNKLGFLDGRSPSHPTLTGVINSLDVESLESVLGNYIMSSNKGGKVFCSIDGKTLKGSKGQDNKTTHLVSLFSKFYEGVLCQVPSLPGGGEISSAHKLLDNFKDLSGLIITGDAIFAQSGLCEKIQHKGGGYLLTVKDNQSQLKSDIQRAFQERGGDCRFYREDINKAHGRIEQRSIEVIDMPWEYLNGWSTISQIACISRRRIAKGKDVTTEGYLITNQPSSVLSAEEILKGNRGHWSVEVLHYIRDVVLNEDRSNVRVGNGPQAMSALRNLVVHLAKKVNKSVTKALEKIAFNINWAIKLLTGT